MLSEQALRAALANPSLALEQIDKLESERSLINFIKNGWSALEPGQKFVAGWAVEAICEHLEAVTRGEITRLLINVPPGTTKSMATSVFYPAWEWGAKGMSHNRYILAAHKESLAIRDNVRCRNLIRSKWYQDKWGDEVTLKADQSGKAEYHNTNTGWRMASSVGGGVTGNRGDRVILDDPHSVHAADSDTVREETLRWFSEELSSRLNNIDLSAIIVIMQRVNERDVSGLILAEELGYEHLMLPMEYEPERCCYSSIKPRYIEVPTKHIVLWDKESSSWKESESQDLNEQGTEIRYKADPRTKDGELLWPERFSAKGVKQLKKELGAWGGEYAQAGQLQQRPAPRGGGLFKLDDWQYIDAHDVPRGGKEIRGWDFAATASKKAAFTASCKIKKVNDAIYILDVERAQVDPAGLNAMIKRTAKADGKRCLQDYPQDPGSSGKCQKLSVGQLLHGYEFTSSTESGSKELRAEPLASQVGVKNVYLVRGHWNSTFTKEGATFPNGQFKDQIDAASRAYHRCLAMHTDDGFAGGGVVE